MKGFKSLYVIHFLEQPEETKYPEAAPVNHLTELIFIFIENVLFRPSTFQVM